MELSFNCSACNRLSYNTSEYYEEYLCARCREIESYLFEEDEEEYKRETVIFYFIKEIDTIVL